MRIEEFLQRLESVSKASGGYKARCPSHSDRTPSLSVTEASDRLLVKCMAGCPTESVVDAMGLRMSDLYFDAKVHTDSPPEAIYKYEDENRVLLFQMVRFPNKVLRPQAPDGSWGIKGIRRVLYRLPDLIDAVQGGKTVYVVDGEKDVEALWAVGKPATCVPLGSGKWKASYVKHFLGATVVIVADKDEPHKITGLRPGWEHAQEIAESLEGIAKQVWIVQSRFGKDAADHLAGGYRVEEMEVVSG